MVSTKKRMEVLFKVDCPSDKTTEHGIKEYLTHKIAGLHIKQIDIFEAKTVGKALVTSNILELLTGASDEDFQASRHGKSVSFMGALPGFTAGPSALDMEIKEKELAEQGVELSKARKEALELKGELSRMTKELAELKGSKKPGMSPEEIKAIFETQIAEMANNIETLDNDKTKLEKELAKKNAEIQELSQKVQLRSETKSMIGGKGQRQEESARQQIEAMEALMLQKHKLHEEEKAHIQENLGQISLKMLAETERANIYETKAKQYDQLQTINDKLTKERDGLLTQLQGKDEQLQQQHREGLEAMKKAESLKVNVAAQENTIATLQKQLKECSIQLAAVTESKQALEAKWAVQAQSQTTTETEIATLHKQLKDLTSERDQLKADLRAQTEVTAHHGSVTEKAREEYKAAQKTIQERELEIRNLKAQLEKEQSDIKELKAKRENDKSELADVQRRAAEATKRAEDLAKQQQQHEKQSKASEKLQQKVDALEADVKKREKELKAREDEIQQLHKDLITTRAKFDATEKQLTAKTEELTKARSADSSSVRPSSSGTL
jgi:DNA repair exonuclease SbcCD ATPase subunit